MKKIFLISDSFYPEPTSAAKLLFDLTLSLKKKYKVVVLTAFNSNKHIKKKNLEIIYNKVPFLRSKHLKDEYDDLFCNKCLNNVNCETKQLRDVYSKIQKDQT